MSADFDFRLRPLLVLPPALLAGAVALGVIAGWHDLAQATVNGLVSGNYFALGAVGLTLIFGVLRLVNFAHGEYMTVGAYMMLVAHSLGAPLLVAAVFGVVATGCFGIALELILWRPVRRKRVGELQLLLLALGLAFLVRNGIAFIAGPTDRQTPADVTAAVSAIGLRIGRTELIVTLIGLATIVATALMLRSTSLGRQTRALADDVSLAETTGINTDRIVLLTWALSAALAGLGGIIYALPAGSANPGLGFSLILSIFAAVVVGGVGNAYGALAGGLLIGIAQEWSTLVIAPQLKVAVGFGALILVLLVRPNGLFAARRTADR